MTRIPLTNFISIVILVLITLTLSSIMMLFDSL